MKKFILNIIYKVLAYYAKILVKKFNPVVVAVTGSVGKTTTKEAIYLVLHSHFGDKVRKNEGNLNAEIGLPLTILGYKKQPHKLLWPAFLISAYFRTRAKKYPKYLILEMGVERRGDIEYLSSIAKPTVAVITSLGGAHLTNFHDKSEYQREKLSIIDKVLENGVVIVNGDDETLSGLENDNVKQIGIDSKRCDYTAEDIKIDVNGSTYRAVSTGHKISVETPLLGYQAIYAQLFAFAVADYFDIQLISLGKIFKSQKSLSGRLNVISGIKNTIIIDDTYNANPTSVRAAIDLMKKLARKKRTVLVLGQMNELGSDEKNEHLAIASYAKNKIDQAIFTGKHAEVMSKEFGKTKSVACKNVTELFSHITELIEIGDMILVKASQNNNYFEEIVKKLMKNPADSNKLLVRQGKEWLNKKKRLYK